MVGRKHLTSIAVATMLGLGALSTSAQADTRILVSLWDAGDNMVAGDNMRIKDHPDLSKATMGVKMSTTDVVAGKITFVAYNASADNEHEMVVARLVDGNKGLVYNADEAKVDEKDANSNLGEVAEMEPGKSGTLTLDLKPGTYVIYCNIPTHYASGMWTILTVRPKR